MQPKNYVSCIQQKKRIREIVPKPQTSKQVLMYISETLYVEPLLYRRKRLSIKRHIHSHMRKFKVPKSIAHVWETHKYNSSFTFQSPSSCIHNVNSFLISSLFTHNGSFLLITHNLSFPKDFFNSQKQQKVLTHFLLSRNSERELKFLFTFVHYSKKITQKRSHIKLIF